MAQIAEQDIVVSLSSLMFEAGFDVFGSVRVGAYNDSLEQEHWMYRLPTLGCADNMVVVVGNTRRLWPKFLADYRSSSLAQEAHPLDAYTRRHVEPAVRAVAERLGLSHALRYSFDPAPDAVAIQRLAMIAGVAELAPIGLCVHPEHGPWLSLRAAAVLSTQGRDPAAVSPTCSACTQRSCLTIGQPLLDAFRAQDKRRIAAFDWKAWLAMRDACPVGRQARYGEQQIRYHYTKQLTVLQE